MIHDLYLRAHIVPEKASDQKKGLTTRSRPRKWPEYALVFDCETTLDLNQTLNFGIWRFCQLQDKEYVVIQEGIFYRDGLATKDIDAIRTYWAKQLSGRPASGPTLAPKAVPRAEFVERIFWESVRAGALIVGFNLSVRHRAHCGPLDSCS